MRASAHHLLDVPLSISRRWTTADQHIYMQPQPVHDNQCASVAVHSSLSGSSAACVEHYTEPGSQEGNASSSCFLRVAAVVVQYCLVICSAFTAAEHSELVPTSPCSTCCQQLFLAEFDLCTRALYTFHDLPIFVCPVFGLLEPIILGKLQLQLANKCGQPLTSTAD